MAAATAISWLVIVATCKVFCDLAFDYLVVLGRSGTVFTVQAGSLLVLVPALVAGASWGGLGGLAAAQAAVTGCVVLPLYVWKLRQHGLQFEAADTIVELESTKLEGISFIISGVFENYSRDELKDIIEANGGKILSSISAKLNYLVAGENMGPAKLEKALKLKIPMISDEELLEMLK